MSTPEINNPYEDPAVQNSLREFVTVSRELLDAYGEIHSSVFQVSPTIQIPYIMDILEWFDADTGNKYTLQRFAGESVMFGRQIMFTSFVNSEDEMEVYTDEIRKVVNTPEGGNFIKTRNYLGALGLERQNAGEDVAGDVKKLLVALNLGESIVCKGFSY
jgi:hypothetical protein